ncbi:MAG: hypothetical protein ABEH83_05680 [Halobacterium sp.]
MERFAQFVVGGGLLLVAGLWGVELAPSQSLAWLGAVAVSVGSFAAVFAGIWLELEFT